MADENAVEMRAMMSRWEALRNHWALKPDEESGLLGGSGFRGPVDKVASWRASRMEHRMRLLVELGSGLDALLLDERRIRAWLRRPMASLGGRKPVDAMGLSEDWIRMLRRAVEDFAV